MLTHAPPRKDAAARLAADIRRRVVEMSGAPGGARLGGSLSVADLLAVLYGEVLRQPAGDGASSGDRDYLVLSKGHASAALYAALAATGLIPDAETGTYRQDGSRLAGHPCGGCPGWTSRPARPGRACHWAWAWPSPGGATATTTAPS